ncbi:MAG: hypothetical protein VX583_04930 [Bdellovibrionota bacterium]|nr:hypothetical protein [Pseudobdellovibrionaceae bacterium]|tara:strand:+ start:26661 stop:27272 length:612 start_codon:yes stop_codon:yes gene_type:complete
MISKDAIPSYIPKSKCKLVILGTMASVAARKVGEKEEAEDAFFYHHKTNHFWRILQMVFEPKKPSINMNVSQKKQFLEKHGIAISNTVSEVEITKKQAMDPSDSVLFEAKKKNKLRYKKLDAKTRKILLECPLFFTSSSTPQILDLLEGYLVFNKIRKNSKTDIGFLMTPTRCNPMERAIGWKIRMAQMGVLTPSVKVPEDFL